MATRKRSKREEDALIWRAVAAWVRHAHAGRSRASFADTEASVVDIGDRTYIVLKAGRRTLAVYRLRADSQLKLLRRPPRELRGEDDE